MVDIYETLIDEVKQGVTLIEEKVKSTLHKFDAKLKKFEAHDKEIQEYAEKYKDLVVTLNVGGKIFKITLPKLLSVKDSLFNKVFLDDKKAFLSGQEFFIDRDSYNFSFIMEYLTFGYISLPRGDVQKIIEELKYYNMSDPIKKPEKYERNVVDYVEYETTHSLQNTYTEVGTYDLDDLKEDKKEAGILMGANGQLIFELEDEVKVTKLDMRGVTANESKFAPSSGQKANIFLSKDKVNWTKIGKVAKNYGRGIMPLKVNPMLSKYIKFTHTSQFGIGYLKVYFED
jgi:hypothetical protein